MKTKLLKRVRKRYSITYYPKQLDIWQKTFKGEFMVLRNSNEHYSTIVVQIILNANETQFGESRMTKRGAKEFLLERLSKWIASDYRHLRKRKPTQKVETIWYNIH